MSRRVLATVTSERLGSSTYSGDHVHFYEVVFRYSGLNSWKQQRECGQLVSLRLRQTKLKITVPSYILSVSVTSHSRLGSL